MSERPPLRTVTASYPSPEHPRRGHFIEGIHLALNTDFRSEILAPQVAPEDPVEEERDGISITRFDYGARNRLPKVDGISRWGIVRYLSAARRAAARRWPADDGARGGLVLCHWVLPAGWIGAGVARRLRVPLVLYGHGSDLHTVAQRFPGRAAARRVLRHARAVIAASRELAVIAGALGGPDADEIAVVPVGIPGTFAGDPPPPTAAPPLRLLYVGDLIADKGVGDLVRAMRTLAQRDVPVELAIAGSGPLEMELRAVADGLAAVEFLGTLSEAEVREAMDRAHVLVLPSRKEGTPVVVQEAIARRLPVLATAVGGIPELFRDRSGWLPLQPERDGDDEWDRAATIVAVVTELVREGDAGVRRRRAAMAGDPVADLFQSRRAELLRNVLDRVIEEHPRRAAVS